MVTGMNPATDKGGDEMAEQIHTLIIDDEENIRFFLKQTLQKEGHLIATAASGEEALERLRETRYDLVIVDLRLGGKVDGLRVLEAVKWRWPQTIVIILTGYGTLETALAAIREGVDGYLLKPVEPNEVRHTVQNALARRRYDSGSQATNPVLQHGQLRINPEKHTVTVADRPLDLTATEFRLLAYLMENSDRVVSPRELVRVVQAYDCTSENEAREIIKWYIYRLRRKVEADPMNPKYILNVRGVGYTLGDG